MDKCLVITGGSGGIGSATVARFLQDGWKVIDLSLKPIQQKNVYAIDIDFSHPTHVIQHKAEIQKALQGISHIALVHCAGYQIGDTIQSMSVENLTQTLNVNVVAAAQVTQLMLPMMAAGSSIIYISSMLGERGAPASASYSISKHAVIGLMRATCQDLIGKSITTCCICPGLVETPLLRKNMPEELVNHLLDNFIIGKRIIQPSEIAEIIHNCVHSPILNGAVMSANLGLVAAS